MTSPEALIAELQAEYGLGAGFAAAYLDYWRRAYGQELRSRADLDALPPVHREWLENALTTNRAGRAFFAGIDDGEPPHRYLDVGCGFGGRLADVARRRGPNCRDVGGPSRRTESPVGQAPAAILRRLSR